MPEDQLKQAATWGAYNTLCVFRWTLPRTSVGDRLAMHLHLGALFADHVRGLIHNHKRSQSGASSSSSGSCRSETPSDGRNTPSTEGSDVLSPEDEATFFHGQPEPDFAVRAEAKRVGRHAPLSRCCETLDKITPRTLRSVIASTLKAHSAELTQELILYGDYSVILKRPVSANKIRRLAKACPCIKQLAVKDVNLSPRNHHRRVSLEHFPATLTTLSVRDSLVQTDTFLHSTRSSAFVNLRVLDLGGSINARGALCEWPPMDNLEELYLEGARGLNSDDFLQNILVNCPSLTTIDLEGTDIGSGALVTLASFAIHLERVYLGFTEIRDGAFYALNQCNLVFRFLEVLCLADTCITNYGISQLRQAAPKLRDLTVNRRTVSEDVQVDDIFLPLHVHRVCNVHIGALFRNMGCGHFTTVYSTRHIPSMVPPILE